jgi:hypothetical protein
MDSDLERTSARVAVLLGVVLLASVVSLGLFFTAGGPFGAINDWTIGAAGVLTLALVLTLRPAVTATSGLDWLTRALAVIGSIVVVVGAALVISKATGFLLAGLVESVGFALVGIWLIAVNRPSNRRPTRLQLLGMSAGLVMAIGLATIPAIAVGADDANTAPAWVWLGFIGWFGIFFLFPIWSIGWGREHRRGHSLAG